METLLQVCPRLTVFKLIIPDGTRYRWLWDVGYEPLVTPRDLVKALLQTHKQRLETLHLDFHDHYNLRDPEILAEVERLEDCVYTYPSFRDFKSLTNMAIEFEKLVRFRDLPMSLEHLDLSYCHFADLDRNFLSELIQLKDKWCQIGPLKLRCRCLSQRIKCGFGEETETFSWTSSSCTPRSLSGRSFRYWCSCQSLDAS